MSLEKLTYQIPAGTKLENLTLNVNDLKQETEFYIELGFKIINKTQNKVFLSTNGRKSYLLTLSQSLQNKTIATGLYHFAILLPDKQNLADIYDHILHSDQITLQGASDHGVSKALYLTDPEGNGIEIYYDQKNWKLDDMKMNSLDTTDLLKEKSKKAWSGFPENTKLGHIHLEVSNLERSNLFYGQILGMNHTFSFSGASFFAIGKYHHHIGLNTWRKKKKANESNLGLGYYTIILPTKLEFEKLNENLEKNNISITNAGEFFFVQDPDNIKIKIGYEKK